MSASTAADDGAVHALGNGRMLVYSCGADVTHVFGPTCTSASLLKTAWSTPGGSLALTSSIRRRGCAVWDHHLAGSRRGGEATGTTTITTAVDPDLDVLVSRVRSDQVVAYTLTPARIGRWQTDVSPSGAPTQTFTAAPGAPVFVYPHGSAPVLQVLELHGAGAAERIGDDVRLTLPPGDHCLLMVVANDFDSLSGLVRKVLALAEKVEDRRRQHDAPVAQQLASTVLGWDTVAEWGRQASQVVEGAALAILAQQSADGGLMAGYAYPLAYGRDQYGACRGLHAVGLSAEATTNFWFRQRKLARFGALANAESMGHDDIRHRHENDAVELTSYHVLQALELDAAAGDGDLDELAQSLQQCLIIQVEHLRAGLLPFNGDETYVAGEILPRSMLEDGSLESTLLFVEAVSRWAGQHPGSVDPALLGAAADARAVWRSAFSWSPGPGGWATNAPSRRMAGPHRLRRRGVCEACGGITAGFNYRTKAGRYVCSECRAEGQKLPLAPTERIGLLSASLLPFLINPNLLTELEQRRLFADAARHFDADGHLRTTPGSPRSVGYDAGLLVIAAAVTRSDQLSNCVQYLLSLFDSADTLSEYTEGGNPVGVRCRPWETGIALAALVTAVSAARSEELGRL